ncbi:MAG: AtpZ/AtpI family protein [Rhodospirillaceae bacterium]|nr:AtpZ/AtpI family protein [Rhodospirillaceae bacterium]
MPKKINENNNSEDDIDDLGRRIKAARGPESTDSPKNQAPPPNEGVGQAMRVGAELLSGLIVGAGIGWFIDGWLETRPLFMIVFFFLGAGAGILNVYRSTGLIERNDTNHDANNNKNTNNPIDSKDLPE